MPGLDGTGPMGAGPMTGRGMGNCAVQVPGFSGRWGGGFGRGFGFGGMGGGRGRRNWFYATGQPGWMRFGAGRAAWAATPAQPRPEEELASLEQECNEAEGYLNQLRSRIEALKAQAK